MEADDLDNLIADSLCGVQSALEADRRPSGDSASRGTSDAVRELRQGPKDGVNGSANEEFFSSLVKTLQDDSFQKAMADALSPEADAAAAGGEASFASGGGGASASAESSAEDYLSGFLKSMDKAMDADPKFDADITQLMTNMLTPDLICKPLEQIAEHLEPWLKNQTDLSASERTRYQSQLSLYGRIVNIYKRNGDTLPESDRQDVQNLLVELNSLGQPPDEVMKQIAPKEGEDTEESFEDFMKSMGLDQNLGTEEQDLLKKLTEDPEELNKAMKEMADGLPQDACKQQ